MNLRKRIDDLSGNLANRQRDAKMRQSLAILRDDPPRMFSLLGLDGDPWQLKLMADMTGDNPAKRLVLAAGRQTGKSTFLSVLCAYRAMCRGETVAVAAPSFRQSLELSQKIRRIIQRFGLVTIVKDAVIDLKLANGGRIVALPPSGTGRGFSLDLLAVDEAAFLSEGSDLLEALTPALALANGGLILASSPPKRRMGPMYQAWISPGDRWLKVRARCDECPRISPEFLEAQRVLLGPVGYAREMMGEFMDSGDFLLSSEDVDKCTVEYSEDDEWLSFGPG